jgi:hypothetical protein
VPFIASAPKGGGEKHITIFTRRTPELALIIETGICVECRDRAAYWDSHRTCSPEELAIRDERHLAYFRSNKRLALTEVDGR